MISEFQNNYTLLTYNHKCNAIKERLTYIFMVLFFECFYQQCLETELNFVPDAWQWKKIALCKAKDSILSFKNPILISGYESVAHYL